MPPQTKGSQVTNQAVFAAGDAAPSRDQPAAATAAVVPQLTAAQQTPSTSTRSVAPAAGGAKEALPQKCTSALQASSTLPRHMAKGIQINSPGPAYRAPGLRRPTGGKPLHPIQPRPA